MTDTQKPLRSGDPCPQCGGAFVADQRFTPEALAARFESHPVPGVGEAFRTRAASKAAALGAIYSCERCGYQARILPAPEPKKAR